MKPESRSAVIRWTSLAVVVLAGLVIVYAFRANRSVPSSASTTPGCCALRVASAAPAQRVRVATPPATAKDSSPRSALRASRDYAALVRSLKSQAAGGDADAAYVIARALYYCQNIVSDWPHSADGSMARIEDVVARVARFPDIGLQRQRRSEAERCRGYIEDRTALDTDGPWARWLTQAIAAGDPAAIAFSADLAHSQAILANATSQGSGVAGNAAATPANDAAARTAALQAAQSGDPDAIFMMADWITADPNDDTRAGLTRTAELLSAWQLLACDRGYDCSLQSPWMQSNCSFDVQCADDTSYEDYFRRSLGNDYDQVVALSQQIAAAIAAHDEKALIGLLRPAAATPPGG